MHDAVMGITYGNFKGAVRDRQRHDAYMGVWETMFRYQEQAGRLPLNRLTEKSAVVGEEVIVMNPDSPKFNQIGEIWKVKKNHDVLKISVCFDGEICSFPATDLILARAGPACLDSFSTAISGALRVVALSTVLVAEGPSRP